MTRRLLSELRPAGAVALLGLQTGLCVALAALVLAQAGLLSRVIHGVFHLQADLAGVAPLLLMLAGCVVLRALLGYGASRAAAEMSIRVKVAVRSRLVLHLARLGPAYLKRERTGDLTVTATSGIDALDAFYRDLIPGVISAALIPAVILIAVLPIDTLTFCVLLVTAPLIPLFMALIGSTAGALARKQFSQMRRLGAHFLDVMQGLVTLKLFNRSQAQAESIARVTDQFRHATLRVLRISFLSAFMLEMLSTLSIAIVAVEIGLRLLNGGIGFQQALFLLVIAPEFYLPLRALGARFHAGTESAAAAREIYRVLDAPVLRASASTAGVPAQMLIRFEEVSFAYAEGTQLALDHVTINLPAGQKIAIVGASGSGKSTLASLLMRFIAPTQGRITVDGYDLAQLDAGQWRERLAWVPQSPYLFNTTVAENIRLGNTTATTEQVIQAAQAASAHDFIRQLPQGYATLCGERGLRLSGGQAQRIAIARAFLKDAPLLILDEATANLDVENEALVQGALRDLLHTRGCTALVIAHRMNTIVDADAIYMLADGRVVEQGTHNELMAHGAAYQQFITATGGGSLNAF